MWVKLESRLKSRERKKNRQRIRYNNQGHAGQQNAVILVLLAIIGLDALVNSFNHFR